MKKCISLSLLLFLVVSCEGQNKKFTQYDKEAIQLNNRAMDILVNNHNNRDSLKVAIALLERAIKIDSTYTLAYNNKVSILCKIGDFDSAIKTLDMVLLVNENLFEAKTLKGWIFEKTGNITKAQEMYNMVLNDYNQRLANDTANISLKLGRAVIYLFTEGRDRGMSEFNSLAKAHPENLEIKGMEELFVDFDRKEFINSLFSNQD